MLSSYLKTALRFFRRQKGYTVLNVLGLAVGLACTFFILLWMQDELRIDRFHAEADRLFLAKRHMYLTDGTVQTSVSVTKPAAEVLEAEFAEIEHAEMLSWQMAAILSRGDQAFREEGHWADDAFFELFSFPLVAGDPETALDRPDGIVISEKVAANLFGEGWTAEAVMGQPLRFDNRRDVVVTGVFAPMPAYSSIQADWVASTADYYAQNAWVDHWGNSGMQMVVRLAPGADLATVNAKIRGLIEDRYEGSIRTDFFLQPFGDQHLYGRFEDGRQAGGRIQYLRIFGYVAFFIVLIACINFMNLATARSAQRAREIGVRKTLGSSRRSLIGQFLSEAMLLALGAFALAALIVGLALPVFSEVSGKDVALGTLDLGTWALFLGVALGAGLLAGSYPAFVLSGFDPAGVLRGSRVALGSAFLRKGLVVFQFAASILLIVCTLIIYRQIDFIQSKHLGFDRANVVTMTLEGGARDQYDAFRQALLDQPGIENVSASDSPAFSLGSSTTDPVWEGKDPESQLLFQLLQTQYGFVETMRMELKDGRAFSPAFGADSINFVINERAAEVMGMTDPVGQPLSMWGRDGQIVGVVRDFHVASLYVPIEPTILLLTSDVAHTPLLTVRTEPGRTADALASLEATFARFSPGVPFAYRFLDERFGQMYQSEQHIGTLANLFAAVAAFIACLGLFGLAAYAAERRRKEIGVRKVLGASVPNVVGLLSRDFLVLVLVACALALPLAWFGASRWLSIFAFHTDLGVGPFLLAGGLALVLAALTVGVQAYRAASADPVDSLRYE